jgi:alpha,alpha-trehalose phosphorylase
VRGSQIHIDIRANTATYSLLSGDPVQLAHHGSPFTLNSFPVTRPIPEPPSTPPVRQPYGRAPVRRGTS